MHVVLNNQVGFTTSPEFSRSTPFCTEIGKAFDIPIIHVNADDPIAVQFAFETAFDYRKQFKKNVIIDVVGYRKHGHNELDQPLFTQPKMYQKIAKMKDIREIFRERLINENLMTREELDLIDNRISKEYDDGYAKAKNNEFKKSTQVPDEWTSFMQRKNSTPKKTNVSKEELLDIGRKIFTLPQSLKAHPTIRRIFEDRVKALEEGTHIDWGSGEALGWATLMNQGYRVRIGGEDVERGTFSHRHSIVHDQDTDERYCIFSPIEKKKRQFTAANSILSEFGALGFELGYSLYSPNNLVIWEAQFGDFSNGGQTIIDQYISSQESKWDIKSGLTLQLPHGMDGMGPEHSSCRLERYLELMEDHPRKIESEENEIQGTNMQVCYLTNPANYFHLIRRQLLRDFRKPLILAVSKKLMKNKNCSASLDQFTKTEYFEKLIGEQNPVIAGNPKKVEKLVFCSGQIYFDARDARDAKNANHIALIRLEQIAPFTFSNIKEQMDLYPNAQIYWLQEEHMNQGMWTYVRPRFNTAIKEFKHHSKKVKYIGRTPSPAPATGLGSMHQEQHKKLIEDIFE